MIGGIGRGHLGSAIDNRGLGVDYSTDRNDAQRVASISDVLLITVRPDEIEALLDQIRGDVSNVQRIISFAAAYPRAKIEDALGVKTLRAMTDIQFRQVMFQRDELVRGFMNKLSQTEALETDVERDIDAYTVLIGCLPGIAAWQLAMGKRSWLSDWAKFIEDKMGISREVSMGIILQVEQKGDFDRTVSTVKTRGGVTEAMLDKLSSDANVSFEELFETGVSRIGDIARSL